MGFGGSEDKSSQPGNGVEGAWGCAVVGQDVRKRAEDVCEMGRKNMKYLLYFNLDRDIFQICTCMGRLTPGDLGLLLPCQVKGKALVRKQCD